MTFSLQGELLCQLLDANNPAVTEGSFRALKIILHSDGLNRPLNVLIPKVSQHYLSGVIFRSKHYWQPDNQWKQTKYFIGSDCMTMLSECSLSGALIGQRDLERWRLTALDKLVPDRQTNIVSQKCFLWRSLILRSFAFQVAFSFLYISWAILVQIFYPGILL